MTVTFFVIFYELFLCEGYREYIWFWSWEFLHPRAIANRQRLKQFRWVVSLIWLGKQYRDKESLLSFSTASAYSAQQHSVMYKKEKQPCHINIHTWVLHFLNKSAFILVFPEKPERGSTPVFEFMDPDIQVRGELCCFLFFFTKHKLMVWLLWGIMLSSDGRGQLADSGSPSSWPLNPSQSLLRGLKQRRPIPHDASLHVLSTTVAWHHTGATN